MPQSDQKRQILEKTGSEGTPMVNFNTSLICQVGKRWESNKYNMIKAQSFLSSVFDHLSRNLPMKVIIIIVIIK